MKTFTALVACAMISLSLQGQVEIELQKLFNGLAFFSVVNQEDITRIENGETLYVWGWTASQIDTASDGIQFINGYNSNFIFTSSSSFRSGRYWFLPLDEACFVWATFEQPFGHRPPPFMHLAENRVEFKNDHYDLRFELGSLSEHHHISQRMLIENINVTIAPNPTHEQINLKFDGDYGKTRILLINTIGETKRNIDLDYTDLYSIPTAQLAKGIYFVRLESGESIKLMKVIVQ
ncbi:MAG: T9SS type A sorting domain-containing protein [Chitinophagales bacterium]|nr:T9SS type A sorting domain-containing protein [Chitinophagales bacterium]